MKYLIAIAALVAFTFSASAQTPVTVLDGGTNNIAASTLKSVTNSSIVLGRFPGGNTAVAASYVLDGAGTSAVTFVFERSVDGSTWDSATTYTLAGNANGTARVANTTNFVIDGFPYLRVKTMQNTNSASVTNLTLKYTIKPGL